MFYLQVLYYDARSQVVHGSQQEFKKTIQRIEEMDKDWRNKLTTIA